MRIPRSVLIACAAIPALLLPLSCAPGRHHAGSQSSGQSGNTTAWQKYMAKRPLPSLGCFSVSYPKTDWVKTKCKLAPRHPLTVGGETDSSAVSPTPIASAEGFFNGVSGLSKEHDVGNPWTFGGTNDFSLQANTNPFPTNTASGVLKNGTNPCSANGSPVCTGWQQFVLSNYASFSPVGTNLYIQFWLLRYHSSFGTCPHSKIPGGWESGLLGQWRRSGDSCYINSPAASVPTQDIGSISFLSLTATVGVSGLDVAMLTTPDVIYAIGLPTNFLAMNQSWSTAEFNVFGLWNGSLAVFNPGTTMTVNNTLTGPGGAAVPASCCSTTNSCAGAFTAETNNLNLSCPCFANGSQIFFTESNASSPICACPSGATWNQSSSLCSCNEPNQIIVNGTCCSPANSCNGQICCGADEVCLSNGTCCPSGNTVCGGTCCPSAFDMCDPTTNACTASCPTGTSVCGETCCITSQTCLSGNTSNTGNTGNTCCPTASVCDTSCCGAGQLCCQVQTSSGKSVPQCISPPAPYQGNPQNPWCGTGDPTPAMCSLCSEVVCSNCSATQTCHSEPAAAGMTTDWYCQP